MSTQALEQIERLLTNLQPHIVQACQPGRAGFIDNYVTPALEIARAALAQQPQGSGEPVAWEVRHWNTNGPSWGVGAWSEWERVQPRNVHTDTVETHLADLRAYIARGLKYELRALYTAPPSAQQATGSGQVLDYTVLHAFAEAHRVSYNELCAAVRAALAVTTQPTSQVLTDEPTDEEVAEAIEACFSAEHEWPDGDGAMVRAFFKYRAAATQTAAPTTGKREPSAPAVKELLDVAVGMLAEWVHAVNTNGTGWDDWDEHYKDAASRPGPLRELLDAALAAMRNGEPKGI